MSGGGTQSLARLPCAAVGLDYLELFDDQPQGALVDTGPTPWTVNTGSGPVASLGVDAGAQALNLQGSRTFETVVNSADYAGPVLVQIVWGEAGQLEESDSIEFTYQIGAGPLIVFDRIVGDEPPGVFLAEAAFSVPANTTITVRVQVITSVNAEFYSLSHVRVVSINNFVSWRETFADLPDGTIAGDAGATAWTLIGTTGDNQIATTNGLKHILISQTRGVQSVAVPIANTIGGYIVFRCRFRSLQANMELADQLIGEYRINAGAWVAFFTRANDLTEYTTREIYIDAAGVTSMQVRVRSNTSDIVERWQVSLLEMLKVC